MSLLFEWSSDLSLIICWVGGLSALTGALGGLFEFDIKRIIAYSTISQLGYMFISSGISFYHISLWHLINHAFFKCLLFLSAGALLHSVFDIQDLRKYGSLSLALPLLFNIFLLGNLSLMAFPFMTGFYSKDLILELVYNENTFFFILIYLAAILTASYSIKLFTMTFLALPNLSYSIWNKISSVPFIIYLPLIILTICALLFGYITNNLGLLTNTGNILILPQHINIDMNYSVLFNIYTLGIIFFTLTFWLISPLRFINVPLNAINQLWNALPSYVIYPLSQYLVNYFDRGIIEILVGGTGTVNLLDYLSFRMEVLSIGSRYHLFIILFLMLFLFLI